MATTAGWRFIVLDSYTQVDLGIVRILLVKRYLYATMIEDQLVYHLIMDKLSNVELSGYLQLRKPFVPSGLASMSLVFVLHGTNFQISKC